MQNPNSRNGAYQGHNDALNDYHLSQGRYHQSPGQQQPASLLMPQACVPGPSPQAPDAVTPEFSAANAETAADISFGFSPPPIPDPDPHLADLFAEIFGPDVDPYAQTQDEPATDVGEDEAFKLKERLLLLEIGERQRLVERLQELRDELVAAEEEISRKDRLIAVLRESLGVNLG